MGKQQRVNPDRVLELVLQRAPVSRSDLSRETGLSRAAVTLLVQEFVALGIVEDNIPTLSAGGRKATGIRLDLRRFFMIALRINRYEVTFRIFDGAGEVIGTVDAPIETNIKLESLLDLIVSTIRLMVEGRDERCFLGVSISILGWLHEDDGGITVYTDGFSELGRKDIRAEVQEQFPSVPVLLEHDAKTSALAEYQDHVSQTGKKPACLLNIVGGIGFGGGIIIDGRIFRGSSGTAGEVGHLGINFNSALHSRNVESTEFNGLFEDYASPRALRQQVASRLLDFPESSLTENSSPEEIYRAFEVGDPLAEWAINRVCQLTAYGLAGLAFVLNPDVVVLGDKFPASPEILERTRQHLVNYLPSVLVAGIDLKVSQRGTSGVLYGSYLLLLQWYLSNGALFDKIQGASDSRKP